jgi:hypothetical protein
MFGSSAVEVAIGLVFVYFLIGLICTAINEFIASMLKLRYRILEKSIRRLITHKDFRDRFFSDPLISSLGDKPSYIPSFNFARAFLNSVSSKVEEREEPAVDLEELQKTVKKIEFDDNTRSVLSRLVGEAKDLEEARENVEKWFDTAMERLTGHYKRLTQWVLLGVGLLVAVLINADTIQTAEALWQNPAARGAVAAYAESRLAAGQESGKMEETLEELHQVPVPIGWTRQSVPDTPEGWISKIIGLLVTAFAVSLGAPFWFDLLSKVSSLRAAGKVPETAGKTGKTGTAPGGEGPEDEE